jgi:hypothetical protein
MSPEQRLRALEELEQRQQRNQGRVLRAVWTSIGVAALVLGTIIGFATWQLTTVRHEIDSLNDQKKGLQGDIKELGKQKEAAERERKEAEQQRRAAAGALANVPEAQLKKGNRQAVRSGTANGGAAASDLHANRGPSGHHARTNDP